MQSPTMKRLHLQSQFNSRLKEYGQARQALGAGTVNPGWVDDRLRELKQALVDLVEAAKNEGRALLWQEIQPLGELSCENPV